jgi:hypothetical protein
MQSDGGNSVCQHVRKPRVSSERPTGDCPTPQELRELALGSGDGERLDQLAAHVEACPSCRAGVEEIAAADVQTVPLKGADSTYDSPAPAFRRLYRELWEKAHSDVSTLPGPSGADADEASPTDSRQEGTRPKDDREAPFSELPAPFGRYLVRRKLGRGGMGAVYLAWDTQLERDVALKIPTTGRDQDAADRFLREARAAAALDHPHVCPIYDHGQIEGVPYLTLKLIDGRTLAETLQDGPLPVRQAVELAQQVSQALEAAHRAGVTHRDLKPGNIMLDAGGRPWVMDFGLARREALDPALIEEGEIFGTPVYMSPEQAEGQGDRVGAPSDIFSLGVVLFEMLCGRTPFRGKVAKVLEQIRSEAPPPPSQFRPEIDARLDAICHKAMAKQPQDRYATAGEMAAALERYLHTLPAPMPGLDASADDAAALRRKRTVRWLLAGAALLLIAILGFFSLGGGRAVVEVARSWNAEESAPPVANAAPPDFENEVMLSPEYKTRERELDLNVTLAQQSPPTPEMVPAIVEQADVRAMSSASQSAAQQAPSRTLRRVLSENLGLVRAGRAARWVVKYDAPSAEEQLNVLAGLDAEVAFPERGDNFLYFSDLAGARTSSVRDLSQESRVFFIIESRESFEKVAERLDVPSAPLMCVFIPRPLEEKMLKQELDYRGEEEDAIAQTTFEAISRGGRYDVIVIDQRLRSD